MQVAPEPGTRGLFVVTDPLSLWWEEHERIRLGEHTLASEHSPECVHEDGHEVVPASCAGLGIVVVKANQGLDIFSAEPLRGVKQSFRQAVLSLRSGAI